jgi:hypothetical protein
VTFSISTSFAIWRCQVDWPNADDFLEKLLDFYFKLHARKSKTSKKSRHGKGRVAGAGAEQKPLELTEPRPEHNPRP